MAKTTIDQDFKVTIPKSAREALGFRVGGKVESVISDDWVMFRADKKMKTVKATPAEIQAYEEGTREYERGECVTLDEYLRELADTDNKTSSKKYKKNSTR